MSAIGDHCIPGNCTASGNTTRRGRNTQGEGRDRGVRPGEKPMLFGWRMAKLRRRLAPGVQFRERWVTVVRYPGIGPEVGGPRALDSTHPLPAGRSPAELLCLHLSEARRGTGSPAKPLSDIHGDDGQCKQRHSSEPSREERTSHRRRGVAIAAPSECRDSIRASPISRRRPQSFSRPRSSDDECSAASSPAAHATPAALGMAR